MAETKIDGELLERIKKLIQKGENKFEFPTAKSFVDRAVLNMLKEKEKGDKNKK
jgi:non-homologous end joining protein Ku